MTALPEPCSNGGPSAGLAPRWHALIIALAAFVLVSGCWNAGFSTYDDLEHIQASRQTAASLIDPFKPQANLLTYLPITLISLQLDWFLFHPWLERLVGSLAPGIRLMTLLYHIGAALLLWRILLLLRLSARQALFAALIFAAHPLACETVCWTSERKNALAGLFGFAAIWAWLRWEHRARRVPLTVLFYGLAVLSKPSALGLLPVLAALDFFGGPRGLDGSGPTCWRPARQWFAIAERLTPLLLISAGVTAINVSGHASSLIAPPGGSLFTAALTDLEILTRYLRNIALPDQLSAMYLVEPVERYTDPRIIEYGLALGALVAATIYVAAHRRRAVLGWLWFVGALLPNLNFVAIPHWMQDRYVYFSLPGALLVALETAAGLSARLPTHARRTVPFLAGGYIVLLLAFSVIRSGVWSSDLLLFQDAVAKQPRSAYAHYACGAACGETWEMLERSGNPQAESYRQQWIENWRVAVRDCPDARRFGCFTEMSLVLADDARTRGELDAAERYLSSLFFPPTRDPAGDSTHALVLAGLAEVYIQRGALKTAFCFAEQAVQSSPEDATHLCRARAALALSRQPEETPASASELIQFAKADLQRVPPGSPLYAQAQALLKQIKN